MGQKAAIVLVTCNLLSLLIWLCCMFSGSWMDKTFYPPGGSFDPTGTAKFHIWSGLLGVQYDVPFFCRTAWMRKRIESSEDRKAGKMTMCDKLEQEHDFHGLQDAFCEDKIREVLFPTACFSVKLLMWASRMMFMFLVFTVVMQVTASFFIAYYFTKSAKGRYRQVATVLLITAPSLDFLGLCFYTYACTVFCDMFRDCRIPLIFSAEGGGLGNVHWAWIWAFMNTLLMFIFPFVVHNLKTKSERLQKEARMQAEFEAEMARYGVDQYGGGDGSGYQDPYSQQQAYDPYSQQQGGYADPYGGGGGYGQQPQPQYGQQQQQGGYY